MGRAFLCHPEEDIESKLHLQLPGLLHLVLNHAQMHDRKLAMSHVADHTAGSFKMDLVSIWSKDHSDKLICSMKCGRWYIVYGHKTHLASLNRDISEQNVQSKVFVLTRQSGEEAKF